VNQAAGERVAGLLARLSVGEPQFNLGHHLPQRLAQLRGVAVIEDVF